MRNAPAVLLEAAECQWLAGLHCDRPEIDLAFAREDVLDDVVVTSGHPARRMLAPVSAVFKTFTSAANRRTPDGAAWKGSSVSSKGTIASAPAGTGAPVIMRTAAPGSTVRSKV